MAEEYPIEKEIPFSPKGGDYFVSGKNNQMIRFSFSDFTDKGYIDLSVLRTESNKSVQDATGRIFISTKDDIDSIFKLKGKGTKNKESSAIYIQADNIVLVSTKDRNIESAVKGQSLIEILKEILKILKEHKHPMESPSIESLPKIVELEKKLDTILSKYISLS